MLLSELTATPGEIYLVNRVGCMKYKYWKEIRKNDLVLIVRNVSFPSTLHAQKSNKQPLIIFNSKSYFFCVSDIVVEFKFRHICICATMKKLKPGTGFKQGLSQLTPNIGYRVVTHIGGSGGCSGHASPLSVQISSFSCSFRYTLAKL